MDRNVTVTVTRSTNPDTAHIGRYFLDVRDTTRIANPLHAPQMTTRVKDAAGAVTFIGDLTDEARKQGVRITVKDTTDELPL